MMMMIPLGIIIVDVITVRTALIIHSIAAKLMMELVMVFSGRVELKAIIVLPRKAHRTELLHLTLETVRHSPWLELIRWQGRKVLIGNQTFLAQLLDEYDTLALVDRYLLYVTCVEILL